MKLNRKEILEFAKRNMQYDTDNPFEATLRALETWMGKNNLMLISIEDYNLALAVGKDVARSITKNIDDQILKELPTQEDKGEAENPPE